MAKKTTTKLKATPKLNVTTSSIYKKYKWEIFILSFAALLYSNTIPNSYNLDDELVTRNHRLTAKGISAIPEIFNSTYYKDESGYAYEYRPIVLSSFALEHQFFGDNPYISHFFNVLLYALLCVLLFRTLLFLKLEISPTLAVAITLIFLVHPAHTEVVASIKNRDEILAFIFALMSIYNTLNAIYANKKWLLLFTPLLFALALLSKMTAVPFVLIFPIMIILFVDLNFYQVMIIAPLFIVPTVGLMTNISGLYEKTELIIELIFAIAIVFGLRHFSTLLGTLGYAIHRIKSYGSVRNSSPTIPNINRAGFNLKDFASQAIPGYSFYTLGSIAISVLTGTIYFFGLFTLHDSLIVISAFFMLLLIVMGQEKDSFWVNIAFSSCLVFTLLKYPLLNHSLYWVIVFIILIYQALAGQSKLLIPSIILLVCMFFLSPPPKLFSGITGLYLALAVFLIVFPLLSFVYRSKKLLIFPIIFLSIGILSVVVVDAVGSKNITHLQMPHWFIPTLFIMLVLLFRLNMNYLLLVFRLVAIIILLLFVKSKPLTDGIMVFHQTKDQVNSYSTYVNKININILPTEQNRPLMYIEQPVTPKDPFDIRAGTSLEILSMYLSKVILPYPMAFYYGYKFIKPERITSSVAILTLILYFILIILTLVCIYKDKVIALGLIIYLISSIAACNYFIPIPGQFAERFLFIPSLGWAIILAGVLFRIFRVDPDSTGIINWISLPKSGKYIFVVIILFYSALTFSRNLNWKDDITLFRHDINYVDQSAQAHNLLALHLMQKSVGTDDPIIKNNYMNEALLHFKKSYNIYPFFNVSYDIGRVYTMLNIPDSALFYFDRAIAIDSLNPMGYITAGKLLIVQQKFTEAIPYFEHIIQLRPNEYIGYENLSLIYFDLKEYAKSIEVNKKAARQMPQTTEPLINIGRVYSAQNEYDSAKIYYQKAIHISPGNSVANSLLHKLPI